MEHTHGKKKDYSVFFPSEVLRLFFLSRDFYQLNYGATSSPTTLTLALMQSFDAQKPFKQNAIYCKTGGKHERMRNC